MAGAKSDERRWEGLAELYSQKELVAMISDLKDDMTDLRVEMKETKMLIRDYNGLRKRLDKCEQSIDQSAGAKGGGKDMWGYVVGGIGLLLALISYVAR